ncbi:nose resistant to fluoxetine protein 6-like [Bombus pascuorum]|uniref:nose resistant to fluoxetine protein 6-like n=1 Tax=Bombus pascuorum TaxID=65598 RepID=UPI00298EC2CD|nr:nose resistant to fluoxetine protein 6-like [Bombus pascuorum]
MYILLRRMQHGNISSWIWLSLLSLTTIYVSTKATTLDRVTMRKVLPAYALLENADSLNFSRCRTEIDEFRSAVDNKIMWALRALDTSGVPPGGFLNGHSYWLGDRLACTSLSQNLTLFIAEQKRQNNTLYRNPDEEHPPFEFHFFLGHMRHNSTMQYHLELPHDDLIALGLCLPASCTKHDVATMLDRVFHNETLFIGKLFAVNFRLIKVTDLVNDYQWLLSTKMISIIGVLLLLCTTVTAATVYDYFAHRNGANSEKEIVALKNGNTKEVENARKVKCKTSDDESALLESEEQNCMNQYLLSFSLLRNGRQLFKIRESTDSLRIFYGMRVLGMLWIIFGHLAMFSFHAMANKALFNMLGGDILNEIINNPTFPVDTFFFMSGFLSAYNFVKEQQKMRRLSSITERANIFFQIIMKRYIRLTPAYFVVILIAILTFTWHDHVSAYLLFEYPSDMCSKYWWTNILYINNLYSWHDACLSWSWYLPNDMQFFIFGVFLLLLSITHYNIAIGLGVFSLVSSILSVSYVGYKRNYQPTIDNLYTSGTDFYIRPWCRIPPYIIGIATCLFLTKCNFKLHLSKKSLIIGWILASLCNGTILFGLDNKNIPLYLSVLYLGFSRTGWALSTAWVVVVCTTNNSWIVKKILSLDIFAVLSKFTYGVYLLNPILITSALLSQYYPFYFDKVTICILFLAIVICSFAASIVLFLTVEMPFASLLKLHSSAPKKRKEVGVDKVL